MKVSASYVLLLEGHPTENRVLLIRRDAWSSMFSTPIPRSGVTTISEAAIDQVEELLTPSNLNKLPI